MIAGDSTLRTFNQTNKAHRAVSLDSPWNFREYCLNFTGKFWEISRSPWCVWEIIFRKSTTVSPRSNVRRSELKSTSPLAGEWWRHNLSKVTGMCQNDRSDVTRDGKNLDSANHKDHVSFHMSFSPAISRDFETLRLMTSSDVYKGGLPRAGRLQRRCLPQISPRRSSFHFLRIFLWDQAVQWLVSVQNFPRKCYENYMKFLNVRRNFVFANGDKTGYGYREFS